MARASALGIFRSIARVTDNPVSAPHTHIYNRESIFQSMAHFYARRALRPAALASAGTTEHESTAGLVRLLLFLLA